MSVVLIIIGVLFTAGFFVLYVVARKGGVVRKRLDTIRESGASAVTQAVPVEKKRFITMENFSKTKLSSNERIKQLTTTMENELTAAGLGDDPFRMLMVWVIIIFVLPLVENLLGVNLIITSATIIVAAVGPVIFIQSRKNKRKMLFEKQLPHALDIIGNALKAGYTFQFAMNTVAKDLEDPIAGEFLMTYRETQFGVPLTEALQNMAKRTSSADIELLNVAVSVQTSVGGNMIEILENISSTLTAKHDLEEDIRVKTSSGKITGIMLAVLPVFLLVAMNFLNPGYTDIFFEEKLGNYMLVFCVIWEIIGFLFIRKILTVKF